MALIDRLAPAVAACCLLWQCGGDNPAGTSGNAGGVEKIAFVRDGQVFSSGIRTSNLVPLTAPGSYTAPRWSPEGDRVAYVSFVGAFGSELIVVDPEGLQERILHSGGIDSQSLLWSADGRQLLFREITQLSNQMAEAIRVVDADTGERRVLWTILSDIPMVVGQAYLADLFWPRSDRIVFSLDSPTQAVLYFLDPTAGTSSVAVAVPPGTLSRAVSPDASQVAYILETTTLFPETAGNLYLADMTTGGSRLLFDTVIHSQTVLWSPDSRSIGFVSGDTQGGHIFTVDIDGGEPVQHTTEALPYSLRSWSPDGDYMAYSFRAFHGSFDPNTFPELWVDDLRQATREKVLDLAHDADVLWAD